MDTQVASPSDRKTIAAPTDGPARGHVLRPAGRPTAWLAVVLAVSRSRT